MKNLLIACMNLCCVAIACSQNFKCGVGNVSEISELLRNQFLSNLNTSRLGNGVVYVPIKVHLFGQDNGTGYADHTDLNQTLAIINRHFAAGNIQFYFTGNSFNSYANSLIDNADQTAEQEDVFHAANGFNTAINLYVSNVVRLNGVAVGGYAYVSLQGPDAQFYNRIWMMSTALDGTVHEMGHFFGLPHTFNNSTNTDIAERELVTRNETETLPRLSANCSTKGDFVCDTPSDPFGAANTDVTDCVYNGTVTDANNDIFTPMLNNLMAYWGCKPIAITSGQLDRANDTLLMFQSPTNGFTLTAPETIQTAPSNIMAFNQNPEYAGNVTVSWQDNSSTETGYIIERSTSPTGPFIAIDGVGENITSSTSVPVERYQTYYFRVKPSNSKAAYSAVSNAVVVGGLCVNNGGQTCDLVVDPAQPSWNIEGFSLSRNGIDIIQNAASGCSLNGIGNFYATLAASVNPGETLDFNIKSKLATNGVGYHIYVGIYADWNHDDDFDDEDETLAIGDNFYQVSGSFIVPATISAGNYRLRIASTAIDPGFTPLACGVSFGEIEDYKLTIVSLGTVIAEKNQWNVYPNPASDKLLIQTPSGTKCDQITITDITGKKIIESSPVNYSVNIENLSVGLYFIEAVSGTEKFKTKFIKQ